jgi:hypothetical protein
LDVIDIRGVRLLQLVGCDGVVRSPQARVVEAGEAKSGKRHPEGVKVETH